VTISVAVMAHPRREALVPRLARRLGPYTSVVWDRYGDEWDTGRRAWKIADPSCTHHLVVQDDAIVCENLIPGLEQALAHVPAEAAISLYVGTLRPDRRRVTTAVYKAEEAGAAWIVMPDLKWGVAVLAPTAVVPDMLAHGDQHPSPFYDLRLQSYFRNAVRWPVWCTWPALVDHRSDLPGLVTRLRPPSGPRVAHRFLGEHASSLDVDWSTGAVAMPGAALPA
jgi:hypothetical protein